MAHSVRAAMGILSTHTATLWVMLPLDMKAFRTADDRARAHLRALVDGLPSSEALALIEPRFEAVCCQTLAMSQSVHERLLNEFGRLPAERRVAALINATAAMTAEAEVTAGSSGNEGPRRTLSVSA